MLRFTDRLLEEEPDFVKLSAMSFDSPGPAPPKSVFARLAAGGSPIDKGLGTLLEGDSFDGPQVHEGEGEDAEEDLHDQSSLLDVQLDPKHDPEPSVPGPPDVEHEEDLDEEMTVILPKAPFLVPDNPLPSSSVDSQPQTIPPLAEVQPPPDSSSKVTKVRVTPELESIVASVVPFVPSYSAH
jgi:hypothetical protein